MAKPATTAEIEAAIRALTGADSGRLKVRLYTMIYVNTVKQALAYAEEYANSLEDCDSDKTV